MCFIRVVLDIVYNIDFTVLKLHPSSVATVRSGVSVVIKRKNAYMLLTDFGMLQLVGIEQCSKGILHAVGITWDKTIGDKHTSVL